LERITLPTDHKKFMPSEGKPPLKPEEITWIRAWILQGASQEVKSLVGIDVPEPFKEEPLPQVGDYSKMMGEISQTAKAAGVTLVPVSRNLGDGLVLNTVDAGQKFGDAQLAGLVRFAPYIVEAELGRTSVTDGCFATLGKFPHLRAIHLEGTAVTGTGLTALAQLPQLSYLNLSGTQVTQAAIAPLSSMKNLHHLYLYNTPAQPASIARQEP
jgi:Leucine-rich repeat (LRR) protein